MFLLKLSIGEREVELRMFLQKYTYDCLLYGEPDERTNRFVMDTIHRTADRVMPSNPIVVIDPERGSDGLFPPVLCVGEFVSIGHFQRPGEDACMESILTIIWFEHQSMPHMSTSTLEKMAAIDWDNHATEYDPF